MTMRGIAKYGVLGGLALALGAAGMWQDYPQVGPLNQMYTPLGQQTTGPLPFALSNLSLATSGLAVDTGLAQGQSPQTVRATLFQVVAAAAMEVTGNTATSTAGAATLNARGGMITTEALTTPPGGSYTFTLTDSVFTPGQLVQVVVAAGTNTNAVSMAVTSETTNAGSMVLVLTNTSTVALNGTLKIGFHV